MANLYVYTGAQTSGTKVTSPIKIEDLTIDGNLTVTGNITVGGNITATGTIKASNTSHIGMIIHSTTLATMEDVIAQYGGTTWIQHSGYFLRGATTGITSGSNVHDSGSDDAVVVSHTHSYSGTTGNNNVSHYHGTGCTDGLGHFVMSTGGITDDEGSAISGSGYDFPRRPHSSANTWGGKTTTSNQSANHAHIYSGTTGGASGAVAGTGRNVPKYKNVYIWERTA